MRMPGFTAEASFNKTSESYSMAWTSSPLPIDRTLLPQFFRGWCNSYECCTCSDPFNCRCYPRHPQ